MFTFFHAIILGLVEGITEFLPISSTGHMILASQVMHIGASEFLKTFEIFIQLGAILAVLFIYWKKLLLNSKIFLRVAVAFVPTALIGLFVYSIAKKYLLGNTMVVVWSLLVGGIILVLFERVYGEKTGEQDVTSELESITYRQAISIGLFQSIAIIPGVSRSAATIVGGLLIGISRRAIVEFSFMLAIPTMAAAVGLDLLKTGFTFSSHEAVLLAIGFVVAFASALFAVKFLLRFVKNHTFTSFGIYRIILGIGFLLCITFYQ